MGEILKIKSGTSQKEIEIPNGKFPILATSGEIGRTNTALYAKESVLIGRKGTIDKPYYMNTPFWTVDTLFYSELNNYISGIFIYTLFQKIKWRDYDTSTGVPSLTSSTIHNIIVSIPTYEEQTQIGNFFKQLDETIALHKRKLKKFITLKQSFLNAIFCSKNIQFNNQNTFSWEQRKLGEIGNTYTGLSGKSKDDFGYGDAKYITYLNVYSNTISSIEMIDSIKKDDLQNQVLKGDVLFTTSSETPEEVGLSSVWTYDLANVYLNSFCFGFRLHQEVDLNYLAYMLRSKNVRTQMILLAQGISRYNISKKSVMNITVFLPNLEEQTQIGNFFKQLDETIALHKRKQRKYQQIKAIYLAKMLGMVDVQISLQK